MIQPWVREADRRLAAARGCVRFGMDDGYFTWTREVIFTVLAEFARKVREEVGCELVSRKCKLFTRDEDA